MKKFLKIIGVVLLGLFLISCGSKEETKKVENTSNNSTEKIKVKVGTEGVFAPFTFTDDKDELTGYDVEVVREIGKRANLDIEFVPTPWDSMFLGLESNKFDFIANEVAKNPEREQKYIFSDDYLISAAQIIVKNFAYYDGNVSIALDEIAQGKADATLHDRLTVGYFTKQRGELVELVGEPVTTTPVYFVFRKESEDLKNRVNKALSEMKADGTLTKISEKWFGSDFTK